MKKKISLAPALGPTPERLRHSPTEIEVFADQAKGTLSRHRVKPILTPFCLRQAIVTETADKPPDARLRSLRRRLTPLDRLLSDAEAASLERLTSCMIGLSNVGCLNYFQTNVKSDPFSRLPFGERKRLEIAALAFVNARLPPSARILAAELAGKLDPCTAATPSPFGQEWLDAVRSLAATLVILYRAFDRSRAPAPKTVLPPAIKFYMVEADAGFGADR